VSATVSGFIAVLIGFASAIAIVLQAGQAVGSSLQLLESWIWTSPAFDINLLIGIGIADTWLFANASLIMN
jgi:predicted benzoate:H+ symporter BenE